VVAARAELLDVGRLEAVDPVVAVLEAAGRVDTPGGYPREPSPCRWRAQAVSRSRDEIT